MPTMRLTTILVFVLCVSNASAQLVRSSVSAHPNFNRNSQHGRFQTLSLPFTVSGSDSNRVQLSSDTTFTFECNVTNLSQDFDTIYFDRSQFLPTAWTTSVCWGATCYPSDDNMENYIIPPNGTAGLSLDVTPCLNNVPDSTIVWMTVGVLGSQADTVMIPFYITYQPPNPPLVFQWSGISSPGPSFDTMFTGVGVHTLTNLLQNGFGLGAGYNFTIHDSLPAGWTLTTCIQGTQTTCTSGSTLKSVFDEFGGSNYLQAVKFDLNAPELTSTDSAIIYFGVHPEISAPADSATYRFSMVVTPSSGVAPQPGDLAGMSIANAWPNPLHPASTLHLDVLADQDGPVTAGIYGVDGILRGTLAFGPLSIGSNDLQATMPDLPSGNYIIRLQQGNNSHGVMQINYIK
jgi:hypothetical protein